MAYPVGVLGQVLARIDSRIYNLKVYCAARINQMASSNTPSSSIFEIAKRLVDDRADIAVGAATPGIAQYARDQKNNQSLDVVAEFNALMAAIDSCTSWVATNFPKDGSGYLLAQQISGNAIVDRQFTPATTAGFRTVLQTIVDAIV